jgi:hypothetical protein
MSELGDLENVAESALGGGGSLQQDAENLAVQEGEKELQNVGGQKSPRTSRTHSAARRA